MWKEKKEENDMEGSFEGNEVYVDREGSLWKKEKEKYGGKRYVRVKREARERETCVCMVYGVCGGPWILVSINFFSDSIPQTQNSPN